MSKLRNIDVLGHILRYCHELEAAMERNESSEEALHSDSMCRNAAAMCILQIGAYSDDLTDDFKKIYSHIPWPDVNGMRDDYGSFDLGKLWTTMTKDVPALKDCCEAAIRQYEILQQPMVVEPEMEM